LEVDGQALTATVGFDPKSGQPCELFVSAGKEGSMLDNLLAEQVQDAIDQGASLDQIRHHFHLGESELRDYCSDIMDDDFDDSDRNSSSGY
jgi:hypothetical protein